MHQRDGNGSAPSARVVVLLMLLAPGIALAAERGRHEGGGLISLDKSLIIQFLNFVILLLILQRLLYKPFLAKMAERTQAIQKSLDEAQAARAEGGAAAGGERDAPPRRACRGRGDSRAGAEGCGRRAEASGRRRPRRVAAPGRDREGADGPDVRRARDELRARSPIWRPRSPRSSFAAACATMDHRRIVADAIAKVGN